MSEMLNFFFQILQSPIELFILRLDILHFFLVEDSYAFFLHLEFLYYILGGILHEFDFILEDANLSAIILYLIFLVQYLMSSLLELCLHFIDNPFS